MSGSALEVSGEQLDVLEAFARDNAPISGLLPWVTNLVPGLAFELRQTLTRLFNEPLQYEEVLDVQEVVDVLREYADLVGWQGPVTSSFVEVQGCYRVEVRQKDLRLIETAGPAVRQAVEVILSEFLHYTPEDSSRLAGYKIKKLPDRGIRQIDLPDDYRLRYLVDQAERVVHVVYLGPHPTGAVDGRERALRSAINRRNNESV